MREDIYSWLNGVGYLVELCVWASAVYDSCFNFLMSFLQGKVDCSLMSQPAKSSAKKRHGLTRARWGLQESVGLTLQGSHYAMHVLYLHRVRFIGEEDLHAIEIQLVMSFLLYLFERNLSACHSMPAIVLRVLISREDSLEGGSRRHFKLRKLVGWKEIRKEDMNSPMIFLTENFHKQLRIELNPTNKHQIFVRALVYSNQSINQPIDRSSNQSSFESIIDSLPPNPTYLHKKSI